MSTYSNSIDLVIHNRLIPRMCAVAEKISEVEKYSYNGPQLLSYWRRFNYYGMLYDFLYEYISGTEELDNDKLVNIVRLLEVPTHEEEFGIQVPIIVPPRQIGGYRMYINGIEVTNDTVITPGTYINITLVYTSLTYIHGQKSIYADVDGITQWSSGFVIYIFNRFIPVSRAGTYLVAFVRALENNIFLDLGRTFRVPIGYIFGTTLPFTTIIPGTTLPFTTLPHTTWIGTTLPHTTLPGTTLPVTTLIGTTLPHTTLPGTTLPGTTLPGTTMPVTTLPTTTIPPFYAPYGPLYNWYAIHKGIVPTTLSITTIPATTLPGTTILGTTLPGTTLPATTIVGTTLPGTTLPGTTLPGTTLVGTTLPATTLPQTTGVGTTLPGTTLPGTTLPGTTLPTTTFPATTVVGTTLPNTTIPTTTLVGTTIPNTTLPTTTATGTTLPVTTISNTTLPVTTLPATTLSTTTSPMQGFGALYNWYAIHNNLTPTTTTTPTTTPALTTLPTTTIIVEEPINLVATAVSDIEIGLTWENSAVYDTIFIEKSTNGTDFTQIDSIDGTLTEYQDSVGVITNTQYWYRIVGSTDGYRSLYSTIVNDITAWKIMLVSTGVGVSQLILTATSSGCNITINGTGTFYEDLGCTISHGQAWAISGQRIYMKLLSDTADLLIFHRNIGLYFGNVNTTTFTNHGGGPNITGTTMSSLPENIYVIGVRGFTLSGTITEMPLSLTHYEGSYNSGVTGNLSDLREGFKYLSIYGAIAGDIADIPSSMQYFSCFSTTGLTGNIDNLQCINTLSTFETQGGFDTITGDIANFNKPGAILTRLKVNSNTLYGNIMSLPASTTYIQITGTNTVAGDISSGMPYSRLTDIYITGSNTITGNISGFPSGMSATYGQIYITGSNTLYGDLSGLPRGIFYVGILGSNTITGDLSGCPTTRLYQMDIQGSNTIYGDILNIPTTAGVVTIKGNNTISGLLSGLKSGLYLITIWGNNTISGDLASLPTSILQWSIKGNNVVDTYTSGHNWGNSSYYYPCDLIPVAPGGLDSTEVDNIIIDMNNSFPSQSRILYIYLTGTCAKRTAASDAAYSSLATKKINIIN
jgi:hypothetical protein